MNVKRKGTAGENELAEILRAEGIRAYRNDQIYKGGQNNPDVCADLEGRTIHFEVKRVEKLNVPEAMHQAERDAGPGTWPVVAHRRNREKWLATMPLSVFIEMIKEGGFVINE